MNKNILIIVAVLIVLAGAYFAFAGTAPQAPGTTNQAQVPVTSGENAPEGSIHNLPAEPAAVEARKDLAAKLGIAESSIVIMEVESRTWSDGCLGLGGPAESCIAALTEGFKVELLAQGESYTYRTDKTGAQVRAEAN